MANVLIIGGGFGGLVTAEKLAESLDKEHKITLVSPRPEFTFYPALVQLAFGKIEPSEITFDLSAKLADIGVRFVEGEVLRIDPNGSVQITGTDFRGDIAYDHLVIAPGRRLATEKVPGFFESAHHLLGIKAAEKFGAAINEFKTGTIVLGLCPDARLPVPVCETAFALARKFRKEIDAGDVHIKVIFPGSLSDAFGGASLHKELEAAFARHRINVLYDIPINDIDPGVVHSSEGHRIEFDLLMLIPPFRGQANLHGIGITDDDDFVKVDGMMRVNSLKHAYAVGDIVAFSGPKFAHMAVRQAAVAAANIVAEINGEEPTEEYYHEIATIIDSGGADSIYLRYGIWDEQTFRLTKGRIWRWAKEMHDVAWRKRHK